jgi:hypothetical protein
VRRRRKVKERIAKGKAALQGKKERKEHAVLVEEDQT